MANLSLHTLGPPEIMLDGRLVSGLNSDKVHALLFCLAAAADRRPDGHLL